MNIDTYTPGIHILCGCMFSGKTTQLLSILSVASQTGSRAVLVGTRLDTRATTTHSTHNPLLKGKLEGGAIEEYRVSTLDDLPKFENRCVIGIDEGQFFSLAPVLRLVQEKHCVIISMLNGDSNRKSFGDLAMILPHADAITQLKGVCRLCANGGVYSPASFTKRLTASADQVCIGGADKYISVCRKCFEARYYC